MTILDQVDTSVQDQDQTIKLVLLDTDTTASGCGPDFDPACVLIYAPILSRICAYLLVAYMAFAHVHILHRALISVGVWSMALIMRYSELVIGLGGIILAKCS